MNCQRKFLQMHKFYLKSNIFIQFPKKISDCKGKPPVKPPTKDDSKNIAKYQCKKDTSKKDDCKTPEKKICQSASAKDSKPAAKKEIKSIPANDCKPPTKTDCKPPPTKDCKPPPTKDCQTPPKTDCKPPPKTDCKPPPKTDCKPPPKTDCKPPSKRDCKPSPKKECKRPSTKDEKPAQKSPCKPSAKKDSKPDQKGPCQAAQKTASKPAEKTPCKPAPKTPSKPAKKTPCKPAEKTPSKLAEKTPCKPAQKTPCKPAAKDPCNSSEKVQCKRPPGIPKTPPRSKQTLLRMPAIPLEETIPKFLKSVEPLLGSKDLELTKSVTEKFVKAEAKELQSLLENCAKCEENWLADRWLKVAYLQNRLPVTVHSSPGMTLPINSFKSQEEYLDYTAKVVMALLKFKKQVDDNKIPVVKMGKFELDNSQFSCVYGTCRIPRPIEDDLVYNPDSKHIVVIYKNNFFKLPVYNKSGQILNAKALAKQLTHIIQETGKKFGPPIGLLSADDRDNWSVAYAELEKSASNSKYLQAINSALFTLSLDQCVRFTDDNKYKVLGHQVIHGGGPKMNAANRWMDKTIQVISNPNGTSGFCYEHSPAEGQPVAMLTDYITKLLPNAKEFEDGSNDNYEMYTPLKFHNLTDCLQVKLREAEKNVGVLTKDLNLNILHYKCYGREFLKNQKLSPDSYIQMALQYAFYKLHKTSVAQYESAHLRIYYGGRTETIRSCSPASLTMAKAMGESKLSAEDRVKLIRAAVDGHRQYTSMALQGRGVDRHLLGLKLMALENNKPIPEFYSTPGWLKSTSFRLSTSQVATGNSAFMCYGPSAPNGYGCCYNPRKDDMFLACSSWHSDCFTSANEFAKSLAEALTEMHALLLKVPPPADPKKDEVKKQSQKKQGCGKKSVKK